MKKILYHIRFRFFHVILPCSVITMFYYLSAIVRIPEYTKFEAYTFESFTNSGSRCVWMMGTILLLLTIAFFRMYHDLQTSKERILLLPQSRNLVWIVDVCILMLFIMLILTIQFITYQQGFNTYVAFVKEHFDFPYWQTRDVMKSLYTSGFAQSIYPQDGVGILCSILSILMLSLWIPYAYTILQIPTLPKKTIAFLAIIFLCCCLGIVFIYNVWMKAAFVFFFIGWISYLLHKFWQSNRIGG